MCWECNWQEAVDLAEQITSLADDFESDPEFAKEVLLKVAPIIEQIDEYDHVTSNQMRRLRRVMNEIEMRIRNGPAL